MVQLMPLHPKTTPPLASFKSRLVLPSWYQLTQVVLEKRPLKGVVSSTRLDCFVIKTRNKNLHSKQLIKQ